MPHEILEQAVSAAAQAPSACNRQPFRYIAATEGEMLTKLANLPMGTVGYANGIPALLAVVGGKLLLFDASGRGTATWTLTLIGVALLVLAASYFAPLPPRAAAVPEQDRG